MNVLSFARFCFSWTLLCRHHWVKETLLVSFFMVILTANLAWKRVNNSQKANSMSERSLSECTRQISWQICCLCSSSSRLQESRAEYLPRIPGSHGNRTWINSLQDRAWTHCHRSAEDWCVCFAPRVRRLVRDERPPCYVWADGVSCWSVITVTGGIQSPKEGRGVSRQMAQFQIGLRLYLDCLLHLWSSGFCVSAWIRRQQNWERSWFIFIYLIYKARM